MMSQTVLLKNSSIRILDHGNLPLVGMFSPWFKQERKLYNLELSKFLIFHFSTKLSDYIKPEVDVTRNGNDDIQY